MVSRTAEKSLTRHIAPEHVGRIRDAIEGLSDVPRPQGARKMRGIGDEEWRLRVGDYRVVYRVEEPHPDPAVTETFSGLVTVLTVGHRQGIYG